MRRLTDHQRKVALEADDFIKDITSGRVQINEPEVAPAPTGGYTEEQLTQAAIAHVLGNRRGDSAFQTAEQVRNRDLLFNGFESHVAPVDLTEGRFAGPGLGIRGPFQPDSTIRSHTVYGAERDPLMDTDVQYPGRIERTGLKTEYLSPEGGQRVFREWQSQQRADARSRSQKERRDVKPQDTPDHFNRATAEYYGQQALRLAGMRPVMDRDRSYNVRKDGGRNKNTTLKTDRLIETNRSILGGDVGRPAGDYRYYTPDGSIGVGDMQVATYESGRMAGDAVVRLQALKGSKMTPEQEREFMNNLQVAAANNSNIDDTLKDMYNAGQLPEFSRGEIKRYQNRPDTGMRAGKMTSDARFMGQENHNDQHRYQHVLYGVQGERAQNETLNAVPERYINVEAGTAREYMNDNADRMRLRTKGYKPDGSAYVMADLNDLLKTGTATDLAEPFPIISQLYS